MQVNGKNYRTVWLQEGKDDCFFIIDQRWLPFRFEIECLSTTEQVATAIRDMHVRGAGCIGAVAAHGMYVAACEAAEAGDAKFAEVFTEKGEQLTATRPTAVNLRWAVQRQLDAVLSADLTGAERKAVARDVAREVADEDAQWCRQIGAHGKALFERIAARKPAQPVNVLTHCNAGWLAFVDYGSATAPIYAAHDAGIPVHVWVDETRPRNQGARLTAWELHGHGVPHTVVVDNVGGHLMQHGMVDIVITGTDRTTYTGDVANKIGTYLKALAAHDNGIPFYVALPSSTFDWEIEDGVAGIPIEQRNADEVAVMTGISDRNSGEESAVNIVSPGSSVANYAFDVTPSRLVSGLITERGICEANADSVLSLYPEKRK